MKGSLVEVSIDISSEEYPLSTLVFFIDLSDDNLHLYPFVVDPENVSGETASTLKMLLIQCLESHKVHNQPEEAPMEEVGNPYIAPPARIKGKSPAISNKRKHQRQEPQSLIPDKYMDEQITQKYRPTLICDEHFWEGISFPQEVISSLIDKVEKYNKAGQGLLKSLVSPYAGPNGEKVYSLRDGKYRILAYKTSGGKAIIYDVVLRKNLYKK